jgi:hypothetical protein
MLERPKARKPNKGKDNMENNNTFSFFKPAVNIRSRDMC